MRFSEADDLIDIRYDNVFKAVFTKNTPESKGALSRLVSALIKRDVSIVAIAANEPPIENIRDRQIRFDINCLANNGEPINVEMCLNPNPFEPVRLEFHAGKLFTGQDIKGADKTFDDLKESYQIAILAKERFFADDVLFHTFEYYDPEFNISLNGRSRIITIELSKLDKIIEKPVDEMSPAEQWAVFFEYLTDRAKREKINQIIKCQEGIAMASEVLNTISKDWEERCYLESILKWELDNQSKLAYARKLTRQAEQDILHAEQIMQQAEQDILQAEQFKQQAEQERDTWQKAAADKDSEIAEQKTEIARLQAELEKLNKT